MGKAKRLGLVLAVLVAALCLSAAAEDAGEYQAVACPEQGFVTRCEAGLSWRWDSVYGLTIHTGGSDPAPCLMIWATGEGGTDYKGYFDGTLTPWMERCLGEDLLSVGDYAVYSLGEGIDLPGVMYIYRDMEGRRQVLFRLFDARWGGSVCYTLRYRDGDGDDTLRALGLAAGAFQWDEGPSGKGRG